MDRSDVKSGKAVEEGQPLGLFAHFKQGPGNARPSSLLNIWYVGKIQFGENVAIS